MRMTQRVHPAGGKRSRSGRRDDLGGQYFRSSWEANYARYLNWLIRMGQVRSWAFEADTFEFPVKRGSRFYTPDFKVANADGGVEYHEVKGWMDAQSAIKLRRMAKHHPLIKIVLIDAPQYRAIALKAKDLVDGWE